MDRRDFLITACSTFFAVLASGKWIVGKNALALTSGAKEKPLENGPKPLPEITAAVDVLVPADPEIPGDFKGSDYHADDVVASVLGDMGQIALVAFLNQYAESIAGKRFIECTTDERLGAIKAWVLQREELEPMLRDLLSGLLTYSVLGTYERNTPEEQAALFASMGWFDPEDPTGTFRIPNEGYVDAFQFPVRLKKGLRQ
jgi:hypothetical protein